VPSSDFFIAFSREPIAGAVIGGILSTVTAVGLFFVQSNVRSASDVQLVRTTSTAMLWFYAALVISLIGFLGVSRWLPSNLDLKRDVLERFLVNSGVAVVEVGGLKYSVATEAKGAAAALLLGSDSLAEAATAIKFFGTQENPREASSGTNIGGDYCVKLANAEKTSPVDKTALLQLDRATNNREAELAAKLLLAIDDPAKLGDAIDSVQSQFCAIDPGAAT
jgi:hypothetical protein